MELLRDPEADPAEAKGIGEHLETAYPPLECRNHSGEKVERFKMNFNLISNTF